ncbi:MAG: pyridoxamine 5'-phosphate oxidase family protein, partial [Myxococcota bacterium]
MEEDQFRGYGGDGEHVYKDGVAKLRNILGGGRVAMLTTADETGALRSRPMVVQEIDDEGNAWLVTDESSAKVHEVRNENHVNLAWLRPVLGRWLSVTGRATVSRDREKLRAVWDPMLQAWFPNGVDDPNICLLKVKLDEAIAWDAPLGNMLQITKLAGTLLGKGGRGGEQARDTIVIRSRQSMGDTAGIFGTAGGSMGTARKGGGGMSGSGMGGGGTTPGGFGGGGTETRGRAGRGATAKAGRGETGG